MTIEISGTDRDAIAMALTNCITILSFWGERASPEAIRAQIRECNAALAKLAPPARGWHLFGTPHDGCPCMECLERYRHA